MPSGDGHRRGGALQPSEPRIVGRHARGCRTPGGHRQHAHGRVDARDDGTRPASTRLERQHPGAGAHVHDPWRPADAGHAARPARGPAGPRALASRTGAQ